MYWRTKEGEYVLISEMSTTHIQNTLKMLMRKVDENGHVHVHVFSPDDNFDYDGSERLTLWKGTSLLKEMPIFKEMTKELQKRKASIPPDKICPECSKEMTLRSGRYGTFWGCLGYPNYDYTESTNPNRYSPARFGDHFIDRDEQWSCGPDDGAGNGFVSGE